MYGTLLFFAGNYVAVEDIPFAIIGGVVGVFVIVLLALLVVCLLVRRFVIKLWSNTIKKCILFILIYVGQNYQNLF